MANKDFYKVSDVPQFQQDVCLKTCIMKGKCIEEGQDAHWFLMCPHYHAWKLQYGSFVWDQIQWEYEHPEETEQKHKELVARAKAWDVEQRKLKREAKAKENAEKISKDKIEEIPKKTRTKKSK